MSKIRPPKYDKGTGKISVSDSQLSDTLQLDYPVFCFKHLHSDYNVDKCDKDDKSALVEQIAKLSSMDWNQIQLAPKSGLGSEKIARASIKPSVPVAITEDVKDFLALRYNGHKAFVGYRNRFIFHIVYIDHNFSVYDHE